MTHGPESASKRVCIGCRGSDSRDSLLRFVMLGSPPRVVPDVRRRALGRGVSVHPKRTCVEAAVTGGAFRRAFGRQFDVSAGELVSWAEGQYRRRMEGLLVTAWRNRRLVCGTDSVRRACGERPASLLVVAGDASKHCRHVAESATAAGWTGVVFGTKESLGRLVNARPTGILAILDHGIAGQLESAAKCAAGLAEGS